jgi:predicted DsbA family dithiol-disulfide isomerase
VSRVGPTLADVLILHHDVTSPVAAAAVLRLQRVADAGGAVAFQGFDVLGLDTAIPVTLDQLAELERETPRLRDLGLAVRRPSRRPPTLGVHLVADVAEQVGLGAAWRAATLAAYWERDLDLGDADVLADLAADAGLDHAEVVARLADRGARTELRRRMLATRQRGIGGVPVLEYQGSFVSADLSDDDLHQLAGA